jgi:hypothetical protein
VLIWTAAFVALYLGLLELILAIAARASAEAAAGGPPAAPGAEAVPAPVTTPEPAPAPGPAAPAPTTVEEAAPVPAPRSHHPVTHEDLSVLGDRLNLLMRLGDARTAGVLTDEEFDREKAELLALQPEMGAQPPAGIQHTAR